MPKTEYEKGYEDGFSDGFSLCQKIYSNAIDLLCKAFQKKEKEERKLISEQPQRRSERRGFRDIPIDGNLQVGDVIYTKANTVLDIGMVKSVRPLEYIPDVRDTITAIRASTGRRNSAAGTIQALMYLLYVGRKFLTILAQMTSAGRLEYHICDADFAGGFGCRHFLCVSLLLIFRHIVRN